MKDTIYRHDAIEAMCKWFCNMRSAQDDDFLDILDKLPSAQPEIIYCRNCRYSKDSGDYQDSYFCYNPHHNQAYLVHSMEFCYHAERKDNG